MKTNEVWQRRELFFKKIFPIQCKTVFSQDMNEFPVWPGAYKYDLYSQQTYDHLQKAEELQLRFKLFRSAIYRIWGVGEVLGWGKRLTFRVHTRQANKQQMNTTQSSLKSLNLQHKHYEVHKSEKKQQTADLACQDGIPQANQARVRASCSILRF